MLALRTHLRLLYCCPYAPALAALNRTLQEHLQACLIITIRDAGAFLHGAREQGACSEQY